MHLDNSLKDFGNSERDRDLLRKGVTDQKHQCDVHGHKLHELESRLMVIDGNAKHMHDFELKFKAMEDNSRNDGNLRHELTLKLKKAEDYNMEMANFIRGLQNQSEADLA